MTKTELLSRLRGVEWDDFEVKEARAELPKNIWDTVCAFANTSGGWIVLGVKQNKKTFEIQGVESVEKIESDFFNVLKGRQKFNHLIAADAVKYDLLGNRDIVQRYISNTGGKVEFYTDLVSSNVIYRFTENAKTTEKTTEKILSYIKEDPSISQKELAAKCGLTEDGIYYAFKQLKLKGVIKRIGPDKGGHWEIIS